MTDVLPWRSSTVLAMLVLTLGVRAGPRPDVQLRDGRAAGSDVFGLTLDRGGVGGAGLAAAGSLGGARCGRRGGRGSSTMAFSIRGCSAAAPALIAVYTAAGDIGRRQAGHRAGGGALAGEDRASCRAVGHRLPNWAALSLADVA